MERVARNKYKLTIQRVAQSHLSGITIQRVARSHLSGITIQRVAQVDIQTRRKKTAAPRQGGSAGNTRNTRAKYRNTRATTNTNKYANTYRICVFIRIWKYEAPYCCITKLWKRPP
jgi:hypothetical protein